MVFKYFKWMMTGGSPMTQETTMWHELGPESSPALPRYSKPLSLAKDFTSKSWQFVPPNQGMSWFVWKTGCLKSAASSSLRLIMVYLPIFYIVYTHQDGHSKHFDTPFQLDANKLPCPSHTEPHPPHLSRRQRFGCSVETGTLSGCLKLSHGILTIYATNSEAMYV